MRESIPEMWDAIKRSVSGDRYLVLLIVLIGLTSFGLGRLSANENAMNSVLIEYPEEVEGTQQSASAVTSLSSPELSTVQGQYVASKNSTKYHLPWCSGAQRIKEENKVWFNSKEEAQRAGYSPAANCKGI